jgi:site-specific recombinase XerD
MVPEPCSEDSLKKAGLNKRVYTHLLRHTRATELASILTEAQMKELLGWTQSSDMPSVYVHLSGRDVDSAFLKAHGIIPSSEEKEDGSSL